MQLAQNTASQPIPDFDDLDENFGPVTLPATKKANRFEKRTPTDRAETLYSEPCSKCRGSGFIGAYAFREQGRCYQCDGKGVLTFKTPKAVRDANKIKAAARRERKLDENLAAVEEEFPALKTWWTGSTFEFAISIRESARKFGHLTPGQLKAALKCAEKFSLAKEARTQSATVRAEAAPAVDIDAIQRAFERAKAKGLKYPKMYLIGGDMKLCFSRAPDAGKNAGAIYVKENGAYLGKVAGGKFFKSYDCTPAQANSVEAACSDPENAAIAYGKRFGVCSACNRDLTDPESVARGIGPICADNFFG